MPDLSALTSTFRRGNHRIQPYIGILPQTVVQSGTLSATPTFPALSLAITTTGGSAANVRRGMTVRIDTAGGVLKGYCRIASSGTISAVTIPVNETSKGVVNFASGDNFRIFDTFRIFDQLVGATSSLPKDSRIAYSDQGANPDLIVNAGGGFFGFVDDGQIFATVSFPGTSSLNVDPDSSSKTFLWAVGDGTITVGTTTTGDITATFPVGFRHVQLTATDSTNGKITIRQFPVQVYNRSTTRPISVSNAEMDYSHESGHTLRFDVPKSSESAITNMPDGALVCLFVDEFYGDVRVSYGSNVSGRSHMLFIGYLVRDTPHIDHGSRGVSFEALSPLGILNQTPALPQLMVQNSGTGTKWRHVKTLNTNRVAWYLIRYGATAMNTHDFVWQLTGSPLNYRRIAITETSSIGAQLRDIAQSMNLLVTCDQLGRILLIQDYEYLSAANRAARTVVYNFTTADILPPFEPATEHRGTVKFVRGEGITDGLTANSNKPVFSNGPGNAPSSFGTGSDTLSRQIVDNQTDLNARTGFHFAKVNGLYDGQFVPQGIPLRLPPGYRWWDPAYNEPATITLPAADNPRGTAYTTATKWLASGRSLSFNGEAGTVGNSYTIDHETTGQPGTTYVKAQPAQNGLPEYPPIDLAMPVPTLPDTTPPLVRGTGNIAEFSFNSNTVTLTTDFNTPSASGGPTVTTAVLALSGTIQSVIADPWSPLYINTGSTVDVWIATSLRLYKVLDIFGARTVQQQFVFTFAVNINQPRRVLATERAVQNFVLCATHDPTNGNGVHIARTTDGTTWTEAAINAFENTLTAHPNNSQPAVWVSGKIAGRAYAFAYTSTGAGQAADSALFQSDDYGANWAQIPGFTNAQGLGGCLHIPWQTAPADDDRWIFWTKCDTATTIQLMRTDTHTGIATVIDPIAGANKAGCANGPISMDSSTLDRRYLAVAGARINGATYALGLYTSRDFGDTWTEAQAEIVALSNRITGVRFAPDSKSAIYTVGEDSYGVAYSNNLGLLLDPRMTASVCIAIVGG